MADALDTYISEMSIIRSRLRQILRVTRPWLGKTVTVSRNRIEAIALQSRLVCEGIVLASAFSAKSHDPTFSENISNAWRLNELIKVATKENRHFLPQPCKYGIYPSGKRYLVVTKEKAVPVGDLIRFHGQLANMLHHRHPSQARSDENAVLQSVVEMIPRIRNHLNCHTVMFPQWVNDRVVKMGVFLVRLNLNSSLPVQGWSISMTAAQ